MITELQNERARRAQQRKAAAEQAANIHTQTSPVETRPTGLHPDLNLVKLNQLKLDPTSSLSVIQSVEMYLGMYDKRSPFGGYARGMDVIRRSLELAGEDQTLAAMFLGKAICEAILNYQAAASAEREQDKKEWDAIAQALIAHLVADKDKAITIFNLLINVDENGL